MDKKKIVYASFIGGLLLVGIILIIISTTIRRNVVTFKNYDGSILAEVKVADFGTAVYDMNELPAVERESDEPGYRYDFIGWDISLENISESVDATAQYVKIMSTYTIKYVLNDGYMPDGVALEQKYTVKDAITLPIPTRHNCHFGGWYESKTFEGTPLFAFPKGTTGSKELYARWTADTYTITYELDGGVIAATAKPANNYTALKVVNLPDKEKVTKEGYTFEGWYDNQEFEGEPQTSVDMKTVGNKTYYAKFLLKIDYHFNGGNLSGMAPEGTNHHLETTLIDPYRIGYIFEGWYDNAEFSGEPLTKIVKGTTDKVSLYAKWEKAPIGEIFTENGVDYIYYGEYPQTIETDVEIVKALNALVTDENKMVTYDGVKYLKDKGSPAASALTYSDNKTEVDRKSVYFRVEPIKWRVIKDYQTGEYALLSEYILGAMAYYKSTANRTITDNLVYANNYEHSDVRKWLNEDFFQMAFTTELQTKLVKTIVDNSSTVMVKDAPKYASNNTEDYVYMLTYKDASRQEYGFGTADDHGKSTRLAITSDYARAQGCWFNTFTGAGSWLLRSPAITDNTISVVKQDGRLVEAAVVTADDNGIRPVIVIDLN